MPFGAFIGARGAGLQPCHDAIRGGILCVSLQLSPSPHISLRLRIALVPMRRLRIVGNHHHSQRNRAVHPRQVTVVQLVPLIADLVVIGKLEGCQNGSRRNPAVG